MKIMISLCVLAKNISIFKLLSILVPVISCHMDMGTRSTKDLRILTLNMIIFGHLNINSLRNKFDTDGSRQYRYFIYF